MGSIRDPRRAVGKDRARPDSTDVSPASGMLLDCPPDIAVSFLAKLYSASARLREASIPIGRVSSGEAEP